MGDAWLAATYIAVVLVLGLVTATVVVSRGRIAVARATDGQAREYREIAERSATAQRQAAEEIARLTERVAAVETLLRSVG